MPLTEDLAVELWNISKDFGGGHGLDKVSIKIQRGTVFGILGTNGAGKTTAMRIMLGLIRPDAGRLSVLGMDPRTQANEIRKSVGVLLENDGLYGRLKAWSNLEFHSRIWHLSKTEWPRRAETLLRAMGLWERRQERVVTWSKGMRVKLAVVRALMHEPKLLLLDEPFAGLDPVSAVDLRERLIGLARDRGVTVVIATHDLAHVARACDHVAVIQAGCLIASGTPDELGRRSGVSDVTIGVKGNGLTQDLLTRMVEDGVILSFILEDGLARVKCLSERQNKVGAELAVRGVLIEQLTPIVPSLEDTVLSLLSTTDAEVL